MNHSDTTTAPSSHLFLDSIHHKHPAWTIYCIQLYTETRDYRLEVWEGVGLSMYENRPFAANEKLIQSPIGPCNHEGLFQASSSSTELSPEREAFAERFLEWSHTYGVKDCVGSNNTRPPFVMKDFLNPPTTNCRRHLPTPDFPIYDLEIFEHEIILLELVPPP